MTALIFACVCFILFRGWVTLGLRAGVGLVCSNESKNLYKIISIFYKCMQTIKLRQTTENNVGPFMSKSDAKGVTLSIKTQCQNGPDQASICDELGVRLGCN